MGALEIALVALAAVVLAANQALKDADMLKQRLSWLEPKPWWNYIPLTCVCAAALVFGARQFLPLQLDRAEDAVVESVTETENAERAAPTLSGIDVTRMRSFFEGRTEVEATLLIQPFIGVPVRATGPVEDASQIIESHGAVFLGKLSGGETVIAGFDATNFSAVARKAKGDFITVDCRLRHFRQHSISLDNCKLVESAD